jgi:hypothetical protein
MVNSLHLKWYFGFALYADAFLNECLRRGKLGLTRTDVQHETSRFYNAFRLAIDERKVPWVKGQFHLFLFSLL